MIAGGLSYSFGEFTSALTHLARDDIIGMGFTVNPSYHFATTRNPPPLYGTFTLSFSTLVTMNIGSAERLYTAIAARWLRSKKTNKHLAEPLPVLSSLL